MKMSEFPICRRLHMEGGIFSGVMIYYDTKPYRQNRGSGVKSMDKQKKTDPALREAVNPVFNTARSCVTVNALLGDEDAEKLTASLGFDIPVLDPNGNNMTPEMRVFAAQMANPGFSIMVESRFSATNDLILKSSPGQVVDLPCGYTPRGIKLADTGIRYFGMDLPAVSEEIAPAVKKVIGENERIRYFSVDATNYSSLKNALADAHGELLITTEGLLMYLTQLELDEVFQNIRALLETYGGKWITTDNEILAAHFRLLAVLTDKDTVNEDSNHMKPPPLPENDFLKTSTALQYAAKMGFEVRKIPVFDHLPDSLLSLSHLTETQRRAVRDTFREMFFWVMTVKQDQHKTASAEDVPFSVQADLKDDDLNIAISGRLDTITSPELLSIYQNACKQGNIRTVTITLQSMTYISSAGLRVFLIMRKALASSEQFHITNMDQSVREIINTSGFSELFNCEL